MKKLILFAGLTMSALSFTAQFNSNIQLKPSPFPKISIAKDVPTITLQSPDREALRQEDLLRDKQGKLYRIGVAQFVGLTTTNSGLWTNLGDGTKVWQLKIKSKEAEALTLTFKDYNLSSNAKFWLENKNYNFVSPMYSQKDALEGGNFVSEFVWGDDIVLNILQPVQEENSNFEITRVFHDYRSTGNTYLEKFNGFGGSEACEVNANCSAGSLWLDQNRGATMINAIEGANQGFCSGSLINNLANDCKPYVLTANHCGVNSTTTDFTMWRFHFKFESTDCLDPASVGSLANNNILGCLKIASTTDGGNTSSDFLLVKLGNSTNEAAKITQLKSAPFNAFWNGWDAASAVAAGGYCFHHPAGDIKKLSTFAVTPISAGFNNTIYSSHWRLAWSSNASGFGVTEGGSSGSPLFNNAGKIIGTLTGGSSFCNNTSAPDLYGKFSWHWENAQNGTANNRKLKPWLDPNNTGITSMNGSYNPCAAAVPAAPVAQFIANQTTVTTGSTVVFTDQSTNVPTSWAWVISPAGSAYTGGTSSTSQNPSVVFNTAGTYTVQLTATNTNGFDVENKPSYITVNDPVAGACINPSGAGWSMGFEASESLVGLTTLNNNNDTLEWGIYPTSATIPSHSGTRHAGYRFSSAAAADDFITTPCFNFVAGTTYQVSYWFKALNAGATTFPERMKVKLGTSNSSAAGFTQTIFDHPNITNLAWVQNTATFTVGSTGSYYVTFQCYSAADQYVLSLDDINIKIAANSDLIENSFTQVSIYPNPAKDELNIDLSSVQYPTTIEIMDITGKIVKTMISEGSSVALLEVETLAIGTYNVRMKNVNGSTIQRFVKR